MTIIVVRISSSIYNFVQLFLMAKQQVCEIKKLREKRASYQLQYPELFRSDTSIYPSYTNLKLPYQVVCRERKNAYRAMLALRLQAEVRELSHRQVRAWDGVRIARIFVGSRGPTGPVVYRVLDPLTTKQRQRLYNLL